MTMLRNGLAILFCILYLCSAEQHDAHSMERPDMHHMARTHEHRDTVTMASRVSNPVARVGKANVMTEDQDEHTMIHEGTQKPVRARMEVGSNGQVSSDYVRKIPDDADESKLSQVEGDEQVQNHYVRSRERTNGQVALQKKVAAKVHKKKGPKVPKSSGKTHVTDDGIIEGPWNGMDHHCNELVHLWEPVKFCKDGWEDRQKSKKADKPCVAYDIGVRDQPGFAINMIEDYSCVVRAYDPSPVTAQWYDHPEVTDVGNPRKKDDPVFKLHEYEDSGQYKLWKEAAGKADGDLTLYAYNWQQLSTFRASEDTRDKQKEFTVKSKTLQTMMKDNGDDQIDVLKIDIEGSEFSFLSTAFHSGCPPVEHLLVEWHSTDMDMEYGAPPQVRDIEQQMFKCGYKRYSYYPFFFEDPTPEEKYDIRGTFYGHAAYCKSCIE